MRTDSANPTAKVAVSDAVPYPVTEPAQHTECGAVELGRRLSHREPALAGRQSEYPARRLGGKRVGEGLG